LSRISEETWAHLAGPKPPGETLWARRAAPDVSERLIAALDVENRRHFLIHLATDEKGLEDRQSRGVELATRELRVPGHETGRYLDITCLDPAGQDAFDLIGGELAERLASGRETAPEVAARVIAKWRRFWGQVPAKLLPLNVQIGLFAEVWFLSVWLARSAGHTDAVKRWRGPFGARHDFEWGGRSVETKATLSSRGPIHRINGLDQLTPPEQGQLLLFSLRLREEAGASNSLPSIIEKCRGMLEGDPDGLTQFERALLEVGYSDTNADEYSTLRLRVYEEKLYRVEENFPRLTQSLFRDSVPAGIERIEYDINLSGFEHLLVGRDPSGNAVRRLLV
jgi:hypothetical protein